MFHTIADLINYVDRTAPKYHLRREFPAIDYVVFDSINVRIVRVSDGYSVFISSVDAPHINYHRSGLTLEEMTDYITNLHESLFIDIITRTITEHHQQRISTLTQHLGAIALSI